MSSTSNHRIVKEPLSIVVKNFLKPRYTIKEVFGCSERIPPKCPTFLTRELHKRFENAIYTNNIVVVYGESKQGKTWAIEKYCKNHIRINCLADMTLSSIKRTMLSELGYSTIEVEHTEAKETILSGESKGQVNSTVSTVSAKVAGQTKSRKEEKSRYPEVNIDEHNKFIEAIVKRIASRTFVFDNFHYLSTSVQQSFCSLLRDFNYHDIKVIIIGIWKEASRITSYAPDLIDRCVHIDVGTWSDEELLAVARLGERALNIQFNETNLKQFVKYSVHNIGIFKDIVLKYCMESDIRRTQNKTILLDQGEAATHALQSVFYDAYSPLKDRLINLSSPKQDDSEPGYLRKKIIVAVLEIVASSKNMQVSEGISISTILNRISENQSARRSQRNLENRVRQELSILHRREENKGTSENFIPLFYFDTATLKLFILEPTLYFVRLYDITKFRDIIREIRRIDESC